MKDTGIRDDAAGAKRLRTRGYLAETPSAKQNSLGITREDMESLLNRLDAGAPAAQAHTKRMASRFEYRSASVPLVLSPAGGSPMAVAVVARNISRSGLGFLHSAFMHPGTPVIALLRHLKGNDVQVAGKISRCRHVERHIHELGMKFERDIDVRQFVPLDHLGQQFSLENVEAARLSGRVLLVADFEFDREIIAFMLADTGIDLVKTRTILEGLRHVKSEPVDLILADYDLGVGTGLDLLKQIRGAGLMTPVVIVSSDASTAARQAIRSAQPDAFLSKPITRAALMAAIAEFTVIGAARRAATTDVTTTLAPDSPLIPLATKFAADLESIANDLATLIERGATDDYLRLATRIAGTASALGYAPLTQVAEIAIRAVNAAASIEESAVAASSLVSACRKVQGPKAA
jgi:CheY-like chemotaxis protein